jgi:hypothetical protein
LVENMPRMCRFRACQRLAMVLFFLSIPAAAHAGSNTVVTVTLTGVGGSEYGMGPNEAGSEYLLPYYLSINGASPVPVICDDYNHQVTVGEQWTAIVSTFSNLSDTRFGIADSTEYHEAAWIASQISFNSSLPQIAAAQFAIWALFSSNTPMVPGESQWLALAASAAANNYYGMSFAGWEIVTPLNPTSPQEYLFYDPDPLPEPGILFDLAAGLISFAWAWRFRRRGMRQELSRMVPPRLSRSNKSSTN